MKRTIYTLRGAEVKGHTADAEPFSIMQVEANEVSDGHHTMDELYNHRHALFAALIKAYDSVITPLSHNAKCWKSKKHSDGEMFEGWFIAGITYTHFTEGVKHITYHFPINWWDRIKCVSLSTAPKWDGADSADVLQRLGEL